METCVLAKIVLLLAIISVSFHVCIFGLSFSVIMADILFMALLIIITNWTCESWIAIAIVIFAVIGTLAYVFACLSKQKVHQEIIENEQKRNEKKTK